MDKKRLIERFILFYKNENCNKGEKQITKLSESENEWIELFLENEGE